MFLPALALPYYFAAPQSVTVNVIFIYLRRSAAYLRKAFIRLVFPKPICRLGEFCRIFHDTVIPTPSGWRLNSALVTFSGLLAPLFRRPRWDLRCAAAAFVSDAGLRCCLCRRRSPSPPPWPIFLRLTRGGTITHFGIIRAIKPTQQNSGQAMFPGGIYVSLEADEVYNFYSSPRWVSIPRSSQRKRSAILTAPPIRRRSSGFFC